MAAHRVLLSIRREALAELPEEFSRDRARLRRHLTRAVKDALRAERFPSSEVSVTLAEDAFVRDLNRQWRGLGRTTDVLSFPQFQSGQEARAAFSGEPLVLGDVVVSPATVLRRAGPDWFWQDLRRVVVHGVLHLCGWDHVTRSERRRMRAREEEVGRMSPEWRAP